MVRRHRARPAGALLFAVTLALPACGQTQETDATSPTDGVPTLTVPASGSPAATPDASRTPTGAPVTLAFGGDVHFEGVVATRLADDPTTAFGPVAEVLAAADLAMVNLETAVTDGGTAAPKEFAFRAPAAAYTALQAAGVDVATLANNHGMDYGVEGLRDTLALADAAEVALVGAGLDADEAFAPYRATIDGQRLAVFGATQVLDSLTVDTWRAGPGKPGLASAKDAGVDQLLAAVRAERPTADTVVVYLHWGQDRHACPLARQTDLARQLADAGADVVVGSHAHVLLGGGWLPAEAASGAGAYVDYGLGNFLFYARPGATAESGVLRLTVRGRAVTEATWVPAVISGGAPLPVEGAQAEGVVATKDDLRSRCTDLAASPPRAG